MKAHGRHRKVRVQYRFSHSLLRCSSLKRPWTITTLAIPSVCVVWASSSSSIRARFEMQSSNLPQDRMNQHVHFSRIPCDLYAQSSLRNADQFCGFQKHALRRCRVHRLPHGSGSAGPQGAPPSQRRETYSAQCGLDYKLRFPWNKGSETNTFSI